MCMNPWKGSVLNRTAHRFVLLFLELLKRHCVLALEHRLVFGYALKKLNTFANVLALFASECLISIYYFTHLLFILH